MTFFVIEPHSVEEFLSVAEVLHLTPYFIGFIHADILFALVGSSQTVAYKIEVAMLYDGALETLWIVFCQTTGDKTVHPVDAVLKGGAPIASELPRHRGNLRSAASATGGCARAGILVITNRDYVVIPFRHKPFQFFRV